MKTKISQEITKDNDALDRLREIKALSSLLKNVETPTVLAINSGWGTGKTTFIKLWEEKLKSDTEIETIYFNAWENDFAPDPLIAFLSEMNKFFIKDSDNEAWKKAKSAGVYLAKKIIPSVVKAGTAGLVDTFDILNGTPLDSEIQTIAKGLSQDAINSYTASKNLIKIFKDNLEKAVSEKRLVIFVDELDRCRPTYAIELLERIKHIFDIENLIFVLSLDKEQLSHSIKAVYGQDFDATGYLRRFIDIEYRLKEPSSESIVSYVDYLLHKQFKFEKNEISGAGELQKKSNKVLAFFIKYYRDKGLSFSLREINQIVERLNLVKHLCGEDSHVVYEDYFAYLIVPLIIIRERNYDIYSNYINPINTPEKILEHIDSSIPNFVKYDIYDLSYSSNDKYNYVDISAYLIYAKFKKSKVEEWYSELQKKENADVYERVAYLKSKFRLIKLEPLINKIELSEQFNLDN